MPYLLGIDIGDSSVTAAVCQRVSRLPHGPVPEAVGWGPAQPVLLGATDPAVAAALRLSSAGDLVAVDAGQTGLYGQAGSYGQAEAYGHAEQVSGFLHRVGDDVPVRLAARAFPAQALVAGMAAWVIGRLWQMRGQAPEHVALAHPTGWGAYRLGLLRAALAEAGLGAPALVPRAGAAVTAMRAAGRLPATGTVLVIFRLGSTRLEVSLIGLHPSGLHELITTVECPELAGADLAAAGALERRALLQAGADLAVRTVTACGIPAADLAAVLPVGATAGDPVLHDLLRAAFGVPVVQHGDPRLTVACGAALAVRPRTGRQPVTPAPVPPEQPGADAPVSGPADSLAPGPQAALPPPRPPVRVTAASVVGR